MDLSDRLSVIRKQARLTQAQFADSLGLSLATYKNYEKGIREPSASTLILLCATYDVTPAWLLTGQSIDNISTTLDPSKTEACFRYLDVFLRDHGLQMDRRQKAVAFNIIFEKIDAGLQDKELDDLILTAIAG